MRSFVFDLEEGKEAEWFCASGCFSILHQGHLDFVEDFVFLKKYCFKEKQTCIFLNSLEYIVKNKKIRIEDAANFVTSRSLFFEQKGIETLISDDPIEEFNLKNVYWFVGEEYLQKSFKENRHINSSVIGNIYRNSKHISSSSMIKEIKTLWNIQDISNNR